jgi:hypothetical protein
MADAICKGKKKSQRNRQEWVRGETRRGILRWERKGKNLGSTKVKIESVRVRFTPPPSNHRLRTYLLLSHSHTTPLILFFREKNLFSRVGVFFFCGYPVFVPLILSGIHIILCRVKSPRAWAFPITGPWGRRLRAHSFGNTLAWGG